MNTAPATATGLPPVPPGIDELVLIAGTGDYPLLLARSARDRGVRRIVAIAFRRETSREIERWADEVRWIHMGQFGAFLDALAGCGIRNAVMAGQITPSNLFSIRLDRVALSLLASLKERNAHSIFGAISDKIRALGIELLPAYLFMESAMPSPGLIGQRPPSDAESADIELGRRVAKTTSGIEIGQTVAVKGGTILAVEAFEGTDETIRRAASLGGRGIVVVKVAKQGHDMRFDIPVIGDRTLKLLRKIRASVLAVEAHRTILLEREKLARMADEAGLCFVAFGP